MQELLDICDGNTSYDGTYVSNTCTGIYDGKKPYLRSLDIAAGSMVPAG